MENVCFCCKTGANLKRNSPFSTWILPFIKYCSHLYQPIIGKQPSLELKLLLIEDSPMKRNMDRSLKMTIVVYKQYENESITFLFQKLNSNSNITFFPVVDIPGGYG